MHTTPGLSGLRRVAGNWYKDVVCVLPIIQLLSFCRFSTSSCPLTWPWRVYRTLRQRPPPSRQHHGLPPFGCARPHTIFQPTPLFVCQPYRSVIAQLWLRQPGLFDYRVDDAVPKDIWRVQRKDPDILFAECVVVSLQQSELHHFWHWWVTHPFRSW